MIWNPVPESHHSEVQVVALFYCQGNISALPEKSSFYSPAAVMEMLDRRKKKPFPTGNSLAVTEYVQHEHLPALPETKPAGYREIAGSLIWIYKMLFLV